jgi:lactobin A/cerein 7B family class IIb bacteriocin
LQTLDNSELESVEGGTLLVGAVALAAGGGLLLGGLIVEQS